MSETKEYSLKDSVAKIGRLYPVLEDAYGNIVDGYHRLEEDSEWPRHKLDQIKDPVQLAVARLVANVCRRDVPAEEKTEWLRQIASMTGWTPKQIAENLPVSYAWVMKYLPDEFKDKIKAEAGKLGGRPEEEGALRRKAEIERTVPCAGCGVQLRSGEPIAIKDKVYCKTCAEKISAPEVARPEEGQRVKCARCGNPTYKPVDVDGRQYCQVCSAIVKSAPKPKAKELSPELPLSSQEAGSELGPEPSAARATPPSEEPSKHEEKEQVKEPIDTGMKMICPICNREFMVIHSQKKHRLDPIMVMEK
jgi:DNA-directed RNA polymerase subunit RPC12/RpoP